jgi:8-oxo-dGTP diphosphatase
MNTMINKFLGKLNVLWPPALTISGRPKTIDSEACSMSEKPPSQAEASIFSSSRIVPEAPLNPTLLTKPLDEKVHKSITVVCGCILRQGGQQILLSMRKAPGVPGLDGKWELPGGKIEFGETPDQTIVREIREELGIKVMPRRLLPYLHTNLWEYEHAIQHVVLACYECEMEKDVSYGPTEDTQWFHVNQIEFDSTLPGTREFVSLAAHNDWFDKVYIEFESVDPSTNIPKRFAVATQSTLFSKYGLVKYWGRIGVNPRTKRQVFGSPTELDEQIFETAKRRLAAGYHISALKGPERTPEVLTRVRELAIKWNEYCPSADSF